MLEPSKKDGRVLQKLPLTTETNLNKMAYSAVKDVRAFTNSLISNIFDTNNPEYYYSLIERHLQNKYGELYSSYKPELVGLLNNANLYNKYLAEQTLGAIVAWQKVKPMKIMPKSNAFTITNKILSTKAINIRTKKQAKQVTNIIRDSVNKGRSISKTRKLLDIQFGFRDKNGKLTKNTLEKIAEGTLSFKNGHIYESYRVSRTESMRMLNIQNNEVFDEIPDDTKRLKYLATLDGRERTQSREMNSQLSDKHGRFRYPDGGRYKMGEQPKQYLINDRCTNYTVFLKDTKGETRYKDFMDFKDKRLDNLYIS